MDDQFYCLSIIVLRGVQAHYVLQTLCDALAAEENQ